MPNIVKNTTFPTLLDLLAPHSCRGCGHIGSVLCNCCKNNIIKSHQNLCPKCKKPNPTANCSSCKNLPPTYIIGERSNLLGQLIHDLKYQSIRAIHKPLAEILNSILPAFRNNVIIVPIPTSNKHIRTRGLDHTRLISQHLAKLRGNHYQVQSLLLRTKNTTQVGSNRKTRLSQVKSVYQINPKIPIDPKATYLILDDVWTTGATMQTATKKLQQAGAKKIKLIILALSRLD